MTEENITLRNDDYGKMLLFELEQNLLSENKHKLNLHIIKKRMITSEKKVTDFISLFCFCEIKFDFF